MQALSIPLEDDQATELESLALQLGFSDAHELVLYLALQSLRATPRKRDDFLYDGLFEAAHEIGERETERLIAEGKRPKFKLL